MKKTYILEGKNIYDLDSFFSEFAKMVNAPNGYFGSGLQSFDDCLFGGFGLEAPCEIIWKNSNISSQKLNSKMLQEYCEEQKSYYEEKLVIEVKELVENGVNPDNYHSFAQDAINYFIGMIERAKRGEVTMFDEIASTIKSVTKRATFSDSWIVDLTLE